MTLLASDADISDYTLGSFFKDPICNIRGGHPEKNAFVRVTLSISESLRPHGWIRNKKNHVYFLGSSCHARVK